MKITYPYCAFSMGITHPPSCKGCYSPRTSATFLVITVTCVEYDEST